MFESLTLKDILIQGIGALGIISSVISFQCKSHRKIMIFRSLNELFFAIQYIFLGAYTGTAMNLVGCVRNEAFAQEVKRGKSTFITQIIFSVFFLISGILTWTGYKSILIIAAKITSTIAYSLKNTKVLRILILCTSSSWLVYNVLVNSWAGILCEAFTIVSIIVSMFRFYILPKFKKAE